MLKSIVKTLSSFSVTEFAKLTGDFRSLSAVDVKVMALTYHLEKEHCGIENIRTQPTRQVRADNYLPFNGQQLKLY